MKRLGFSGQSIIAKEVRISASSLDDCECCCSLFIRVVLPSLFGTAFEPAIERKSELKKCERSQQPDPGGLKCFRRAFAVIVRNDNIQSSLTRERGMIFSKYCALQGRHHQSAMQVL